MYVFSCVTFRCQAYLKVFEMFVFFIMVTTSSGGLKGKSMIGGGTATPIGDRTGDCCIYLKKNIEHIFCKSHMRTQIEENNVQ